jgi:L-fuconolactonase
MPVGVRATVVVQTIADPEETPELLALAKQASLVAGVVGWADLTDPGLTEVLRALRERPGGDRLVGIRHPVQGEADPRWLCRPDVRRGLPPLARRDSATTCSRRWTSSTRPSRPYSVATGAFRTRSSLQAADRRGELLPWRDQIKELAGRPMSPPSCPAS